jgi:hypothetical protein
VLALEFLPRPPCHDAKAENLIARILAGWALFLRPGAAAGEDSSIDTPNAQDGTNTTGPATLRNPADPMVITFPWMAEIGAAVPDFRMELQEKVLVWNACPT